MLKKLALILIAAVLLSGAKPYTIMIYMNGSDLESEHGLATDDIVEMLESGLKSEVANLVIFTGGTLRWLNDVMQDGQSAIWDIEDGYIYEVARLGALNMGDPHTLADFLLFAMENYPADKYGLIMWDHGGGSIAGFGHDEVFYDDYLSLVDMDYAFELAGLRTNKLEFLGFDTCLMGSVEMALIASDYAKYFIASEDLEPGEGWDYRILGVLNDKPAISGGELGVYIVDSFMDFFGEDSDEILTLSVVDLSRVAPVMDALGALMERCRDNLSEDEMRYFRAFAKRRGLTKTFGAGSYRDSDSDMVDIGDMATRLGDLFPEETNAVLAALNHAVLYNRHNSDVDLGGLSSYYIYAGKQNADGFIQTYKSLGMDESYTKYLRDFADLLTGTAAVTRSGGRRVAEFDYGSIMRVELALLREMEDGQAAISGLLPIDMAYEPQDAIWPTINGHYVMLCEINRTAHRVYHAVPGRHNGQDCDIIVCYDIHGQNGKVLGTRSDDGMVVQKGLDPIRPGDTLAFYHKRPGQGLILGPEFTINSPLQIKPAPPANSHFGLLLTDAAGNEVFVY